MTPALGLTLLALSVALAVLDPLGRYRRHRERREVEARLRVLCGGRS
jgi:hypothetical protein